MPDRRENASLYILGAGLLFFLIAAGVVVFSPWIGMSKRMSVVTDINNKTLPAPQHDAAQRHGREIYIREKCWLCHSQVVRGDWVRAADGMQLKGRAGDVERYGPISQPGESAADTPHMYGTRRIGPDLARVGAKYADAWHLAHFLNPQAVTPGSIMPKFTWLYINIQYNDKGAPTRGDPTVELQDLISYLQSLGIGIGDWRAATTPMSTGESPLPAMSEAQLIAKGKEIFGKSDCTACHGVEGMGDGAAAAGFPDTNRPANFHSGKWKFGGDDSSVQESILKGRPPYMPGHPQFGNAELVPLSAFVRSLSGK